MKKNNDLVSVIIPVYNVEMYLEKCLDSIIEQLYKNLEVILVDDGSTDKSGKICDKYIKRDKRIKVYHKQNGGLSDARNFGISKANGKYIVFVDSDDFVSDDYIETMYTNMIKYNVDISICGYCNYYNNNKIEYIGKNNIKKIYNKIDSLKFLNILGYYSDSACNKMFKKNIFKEFHFEIGKKYEDTRLMYKIFEKSKKVYYDSTPKYYYRKREGSIVTDKRYMDELIEAVLLEKEYLSKYPELIPYLNQHLLISYMSIFNSNFNNVKLQNEIWFNSCELKKNFSYKYLSFKKKIQLFLFINFNKIYRLLYLSFKR